MDAARAVEMAGEALLRNSAADRAARERRITEENHGAENEQFLAECEDEPWHVSSSAWKPVSFLNLPFFTTT